MLLRQWVTEVKLGMSGKLCQSNNLLPNTGHSRKSGTETHNETTAPVVLIELEAK